MLFTKNVAPDIEAFWENLENELGSPILSRTLGRVVQNCPLWGLFYTTRHAVYFQTFQTKSWISLLVPGRKDSKEAENRCVEIPLSSLIRCEIVPKKTILPKIIQPPTLVDITWRNDADGEQRTYLVEMEGDARKFVASVSI